MSLPEITCGPESFGPIEKDPYISLQSSIPSFDLVTAADTSQL
jgi:hypothetical protein